MRASGKHYSVQKRKLHYAKVAERNGVGIHEDGTRVYGIGAKRNDCRKSNY